MIDPHLWWYVTRASGLVAWAALTGSVLWGVLLATRVLRSIDNPAWLQDLHRWLGGTALTMTGLHMLSLMLDSWAHFAPTDLLVPLAADYRPWPVALGVVAFYLLVAVYTSSLLQTRMPRRFWKALHYGSYAAVVLVSFHAGWSGTDVGAWGYRLVAFALLGLTTAAVLVRILTSAGDAPVSASPRLPAPRTMTVTATYPLARDIVGIDLASADGTDLPIWTPGAHLTVHLPNGLRRCYSLCGDPADRSRYRIAVHRAPHSRGGSDWLHTAATPGTTLDVSGPDNNFALEPAREYLFLAGGIGITPIKVMIESLPAHRSWQLIYIGRSRVTMAFGDELERRFPANVSVHARDETGARPDLARLLAGTTAAVYCCGPASLTEAVNALVPPAQLHVERFAPADQSTQRPPRPFDVTCSRSGTHVHVPENRSLLDALEKAHIPVYSSCREGVCGACRIPVLAGRAEHMDSVAPDEDKDAAGIMYPCVSRARTPMLTLDV
ncbi:2Fe-2S iron-sulfur cluster-binding protein [Mycobacterium sp. CVI_P3]|uniref:2Fe-2S iron-sulfur cluster-binding protein n=1 Tax=Mycobacterium pinniadriaticum TaxID=2994102 RepID=A0ABT3SMA2_9MYCO|nr:2Fe-2S iron-sulfur cluster-binding protein [Mycobacterium pinniadriaticum]MCX2933878.1 2Fe-2S iron-sulfur cluster-binding protein [Mycobacterium pinniadriaticum]MCX2940269.1 2Fe-2S iron-sulfur cluster-binding protein [Mycobacterium pinniadriaticum]